MKLKPIKREAHIGMSVEFSNIELTVLKTKLNDFAKAMQDKEGVIKAHNKFSEDSRINIADVISFLSKLTQDIVSLQEAHDELFFDFTDEKQPVHISRINQQEVLSVREQEIVDNHE